MVRVPKVARKKILRSCEKLKYFFKPHINELASSIKKKIKLRK
jgi:hypothetical protein